MTGLRPVAPQVLSVLPVVVSPGDPRLQTIDGQPVLADEATP